MKTRRQAGILDVIQRAPVRSQEQVRRSLRTAGFDVTEATLQRAFAEYLLRVDRVQQLVLLRTGLARAQALCVTIDDAHLPEVVGTVAGEDTVLVVAPDAKRAKALVKR